MASTTAAMSCPKIMRRPAAAATPTEVVCGTSMSSEAATKEKENAPVILQNKGAFSPSAVILDKEEKRDVPKIMIMKPRAGQAATAPTGDAPKSESPSSSPSSPGNGATDAAATADVDAKAASWNPLEEVDSALLSAMCDARERKALFRLEQVIVDFMKDESSGSIEVGGALNSIVLNWNNGGGNRSNGESSNGQMSALYQQGLQDLHYQQQRGLRQTSFQRLILHRLADRFNIIREQINGNGGLVDMGIGIQPLAFSPGLIRLLKTSESCIPSRLLIDIDPSLLANYKNPRARNYGGGNSNISTNATFANNSNYEDSTVKNLTENMASSTLETPSAMATSSSLGSGKKASKKMVIMKRNSSSGSSNHEGRGKGKQKGKSRRKKLEEREKAYEEARARIFGISELSGNETNDGVGDDNVDKRESMPSVPQSADSQDVGATPLNSCHSSFSVENDGIPSSSGVSTADHVVPSQLISANSSRDRSSPPSPDPPMSERVHAAASSPRAASVAEVETLRQSSSLSTSSVPAAVTSGAVFKAVYRNRQQEENDPDFKRRNDVRPSYVPYVAANPYAGYGVNPAAMGQQPPPPVPAMMAMHVQQQQQAVGHQTHFYHGSAPGQQFPTPQDAVAAAYSCNPSVGSSPPPQWAAAPPRGYYPPHQQQGQQEKHPQAWQPRSNNASQGQQPNGGSNSGNNNYGAKFNASSNNATDNPQTSKPNKLLWGQGAQGGGNTLDKTAVSRTAEDAASLGRKDDAGVYKAEDFPALG